MLNKENTGVSIKSLNDIKELYVSQCAANAKEHIIANFKEKSNRELTKDELALIEVSLLAGVETFIGFADILSNHLDVDIYKKSTL